MISPGWQAGPVPDQQELIRPARPDNRARVWPLARDFATSYLPERTAFDRTWRRLVEAPDTLPLVAETADGDIVGYLLGNRRRSGVGRRLMECAEDWARSTGAAYFALASRRAGPFYTALGYDDSAVYYKKTLT
jgi:GNAT superfamily N-acetyltransferase